MKTKKRKVNNYEQVMKQASHMTLNDLKRHCISRGMDFQELIDGTVISLQNWYHRNSNNDIDLSRIAKFDDWLEKILRDRGKEELIHPQLRLSYISENQSDDKPKKEKPKKEKKKPREKNKHGIFKGTKKAYTFELQQKGKTLTQVIKKVTRKFPDASDKSIKIWYKKAARLNG
ncbi:MAG: hypothetical protein CL596_05035 [Alteromonas sp.]|nr:hypothetical protein [Alteromonas sp.]|tara:strand:- start:5555 stop:6076 length:522 start_codon:yes stop_codon:yes gene_type:complete